MGLRNPTGPYAMPYAGDRQKRISRLMALPDSRRLVASLAVDPWLVPVRDISRKGLTLVVRGEVKAGQILALKLFNTNCRFECQIPIQVVSHTSRAEGDFVVDGSFARELTNREIEGLGLLRS